MLGIVCSTRMMEAISVISGTEYLPSPVGAADGPAPSQNSAERSGWIHYPEEYINVSCLSDVCTTQCRQSLPDVYSKAVSACGTILVNVTTNTTPATLVPLDLAAQPVFQDNVTCVEDEYDAQAQVQPRR
jgi:hypothetical protein